MEEATRLRERGDPEGAVAALRAVADDVGNPEREAAAYEAALLLHGLGDHGAADQLAARLGFKLRLADPCFHALDADSASVAAQPPPDKLCAVDECIGPALLERLGRLFAPSSPFWTEHGYPSDHFWSYHVPIAGDEGDLAPPRKRARRSSGRRRKGATASSAPGAALIRSVADALLPLVRRVAGAAVEGVRCVEWWAHSRPGSGAGHQLHWDLDEKRLGSQPIPHPLVSCVLYLDTDGGAPTLVTDHHIRDEASPGATQGWLCHPRPNRCLLFDGGLLHGVVPSARPSVGGLGHRTTLMLGFWGETPALTEDMAVLGPNMTRPFCSPKADGAEPAWPALCTEAEAGEGGPAPKSPGQTDAPVQAVSPVWVPVAPPRPSKRKKAKRKTSGTTTVFFGRFLLTTEDAGPSLRQEALGDHGESADDVVEEVSMEELERLRKLYN